MKSPEVDNFTTPRYRDIGVRDTPEMRVDVLCTSAEVLLSELASGGH